MRVFYRIYPGKPDDRPFANGDKRTLMRVCLHSFVRSCQQVNNLDVQLNILLDGCPDEWVTIARCAALDIPHNIIMLDGIGNKPSFLKQLEMALDGPDDEFVYFAEDDYLYRKEAVTKMLNFAQFGFEDFITLYDHPDRYSRGDDRSLPNYIEVWDWHWRTVESTTMTFGAQRSTIRNAEGIIREYACEGRRMWYPILMERSQFYWHPFLWSPIPSLATHVQNDVLAPCVDWEGVWNGNQ